MDAYTELLDAAISHLRDLKREGRRYVAVSDSALNALTAPVPSRPRQAGSAAPRLPNSVNLRAPLPAPEPKTLPVEPQTAVVDKARALSDLRERALLCQKCPNLAAARKSVVFGVGNPNAGLMFVGEAPGADEDIQGEPFVGRAGQLLTKIIQTMGLSRDQVYIANILKCRPDTPGQTSGNRAPTPEEMERCLPYLHVQIDIIKPKVIVALGATALEGLFGKTAGKGITRQRGHWREYRGTPVMPTYHPSYLLRPNPNNIKRETWEDMLQVMERLEMPASEKQKSYFLRREG
jgi:DNA polymerase